jgi:hypothetical protein
VLYFYVYIGHKKSEVSETRNAYGVVVVKYPARAEVEII